MAESAMPKKTPAKKTLPKKEKRDPSQIALSVVLRAAGIDSLVAPKTTKKKVR